MKENPSKFFIAYFLRSANILILSEKTNWISASWKNKEINERFKVYVSISYAPNQSCKEERMVAKPTHTPQSSPVGTKEW